MNWRMFQASNVQEIVRTQQLVFVISTGTWKIITFLAREFSNLGSSNNKRVPIAEHVELADQLMQMYQTATTTNALLQMDTNVVS